MIISGSINCKFNTINAYLFALACFLLAMSFYFEWFKELQPCPLCILQRCMVMLLLVLTLAGIVAKGNRWRSVLSGLQLCVAISGLLLAGRQTWLQHVVFAGDSVCAPGLNYMLQYLPWTQVMKLLFYGSGECSKIDWLWMNMTMSQWLMLFFGIFVLGALLNLIRRRS